MTNEDETPDAGLPDDPGDQVEAIASLLEETETDEKESGMHSLPLPVSDDDDHDVPDWAVDIYLDCQEAGITVEQFQEVYGA